MIGTAPELIRDKRRTRLMQDFHEEPGWVYTTEDAEPSISRLATFDTDQNRDPTSHISDDIASVQPLNVNTIEFVSAPVTFLSSLS